ncbi:hypothetical protein HXX76_013941 [Chlamydomonas incerta]|uniref:Protein N-terminal glutamine amidohydrolase n=1 Tax=Chlamydomonas incerta TaxID=51695 RepID=A0A835VTE4_CHLIN|nr:hypothetical protein HXX76_013941 [Chlamydomonas incerta]|eukprot:KAG2425188.1 hypothetical protein HXX76_013941 [Chlamydomonas incerta]
MPIWQQRAGLRHQQGSSASASSEEEEEKNGGGYGVDDDEGGAAAAAAGASASGAGAGAGCSAQASSEQDGRSNKASRKSAADEGRDEEGDDSRGLVVWDYHVILLQRIPLVGQTGPGTGAATAAGAEAAATATAGSGPLVRVPAAAAGAAGRETGEDGETGSGTAAAAGDALAAVAAAAAAAGAGCAGPSGVLVWDLDALLPLPCSLEQYAARALHAHQPLRPAFRRYYRVVPAAAYLSHFASDRSHMRRPGGGWSSPPPPYPPLVAPADGATHTLERYWDMAPSAGTQAAAATAIATLQAAELEGALDAAAGEGSQEPARDGGLGQPGGAGAGWGRRAEGRLAAARVAASAGLLAAVAAAGPFGMVMNEPLFLMAFGAAVQG